MSTLLGAIVGALTNLATSGWSWALAAGALVAAGCWVAWEMRLRSRDQREAAAEARARVLSIVDSADSGGGGGAFDLLVATRRVMPTQGRRMEFEQLQDWSDEEALVNVLVLSGPAGVGKTRLALEFGLSLPEPWVAGWLVPGRGAEAVRAIAAGGDPTLVLVDDADTRADLPDLLAAAAEHTGAPWLRILLVVRDGTSLQAMLRPLVPDAARHLARGPVLQVGALGGAGDRERWYAQAVGRFAVRLGVPAPTAKTLAGHVGTDGETTLILLARALLTVLASGPQRDTSGVVRRMSAGEVIGELFAHEEAWWESSASAETWGVLSLGAEVRQRCVLALALRGGTGEQAAALVLRRLPDLADASELQVRNAARWVAHLYPAAGYRIEPDLLGDWFIVDRLLRHPNLAVRLLADLDQTEEQQVLTVLTRAASVFPAALPILARVWRAGGAEVAQLAIRFASIHHTAMLDEHLATFISDIDATSATFAALDRQLDDYSLPRTRLSVARRLVSLWRADTSDEGVEQLGRALNNLGSCLSRLGKHRQARAATAEAVTIWRELAAGNPAYRAFLGDALRSVSNRLRELGEHRQSLTAANEAVLIWQELVNDDPAYRSELARALNSLGKCLANLGDRQRAQLASIDAVTIWRDLLTDDPAYRSELARALNDLGNHSSSLGEYLRAMAATYEAVTIWRHLVADEPADRAELASTLNNLGSRQAELGEHRQALQTTNEAVAVWRELALVNTAHRPDLARTLNNVGSHLAEVGERRQAISATIEAVDLWRAIVPDNPAYRPDFAGALINLGTDLSGLREHRQALTVTNEAVVLWRDLAADNVAHRPLLAQALNALSSRFSELGDHRQAHAASEESIAIWQELNPENPAHRSEFARALHNQAANLCELEDHDSEFAHRQDSLRQYEACLAADTTLYAPQYRQAVAGLQAAYVQHGRHEEAAVLGITPHPPVV
ncbi:tetratricopeptide repeat protein [Paractinoplanes toevensis]|uniref:Tetratricopeptide repeat protein n=1 Tax=Paractinoplanes toevensis TaxID=571911 RepID=A0A919T642_9ACTN|nr:tetratricopeptide repeat protein [Actinoplanes toevensis]GIM88696.1 hypothetical protein Ato02nite_004890 [Actinoplanes toevensis]